MPRFSRRALSPVLGLAIGLWIAPVAARAQFGTKELTTVIPTAAFVPQSSSIQFANVGFTYFQNLGAASALFLADAKLPVGAKVNSVCVAARDDDATAGVGFDFAAIELGDTGHDPTFTSILSGGTGVAETPGYKLVCVDAPANTTIRAFGDADGDGSPSYLSYRIAVVLPPFNAAANVSFGGAIVKWQRQQAPAPLTATFGDVPTNYLFFRAIENLAASGITGGCATGQFCPNSPITRGEVAAFLSKGLGLNWQQ